MYKRQANPSKLTNYAEQAKIYDYSDLHTTVDKPRAALVATDLKSALEIGKKSLESSAFIFEASHMFGEEGQTVADYTGDFRRGNTPYVLVLSLIHISLYALEEWHSVQISNPKRLDGTLSRHSCWSRP